MAQIIEMNSRKSSMEVGHRPRKLKKSVKNTLLTLAGIVFLGSMLMVMGFIESAPKLTKETAHGVAVNWVQGEEQTFIVESSDSFSISSFKTKNQDGDNGFLVTIEYDGQSYDVIVTQGADSSNPSERDWANPDFEYEKVKW